MNVPFLEKYLNNSIVSRKLIFQKIRYIYPPSKYILQHINAEIVVNIDVNIKLL
jgi:hypothetical protein